MTFGLDGKVALVTGAASGIGAATAVRFARAGADVVLTWYERDPHDPEPVAAAVRATGHRALVRSCDVSDGDSVTATVAAAVAEFGGLDIVVSNAGIARDVAIEQLTDAHWTETIETNLGGAMRCFRAAVPHLRARGGGRLLATSSLAGGVQGWPNHVHYCASKAGIVGLVRGLAVELARDGITVNAIAPGVIVTPQSLDPVNSLGEEGAAQFGATVPVGRLGEPDEIAAAFQFLASTESSYLTGQLLTIDGGVSLSLV